MMLKLRIFFKLLISIMFISIFAVNASMAAAMNGSCTVEIANSTWQHPQEIVATYAICSFKNSKLDCTGAMEMYTPKLVPPHAGPSSGINVNFNTDQAIKLISARSVKSGVTTTFPTDRCYRACSGSALRIYASSATGNALVCQ